MRNSLVYILYLTANKIETLLQCRVETFFNSSLNHVHRIYVSFFHSLVVTLTMAHAVHEFIFRIFFSSNVTATVMCYLHLSLSNKIWYFTVNMLTYSYRMYNVFRQITLEYMD